MKLNKFSIKFLFFCVICFVLLDCIAGKYEFNRIATQEEASEMAKEAANDAADEILGPMFFSEEGGETNRARKVTTRNSQFDPFASARGVIFSRLLWGRERGYADENMRVIAKTTTGYEISGGYVQINNGWKYVAGDTFDISRGYVYIEAIINNGSVSLTMKSASSLPPTTATKSILPLYAFINGNIYDIWGAPHLSIYE